MDINHCGKNYIYTSLSLLKLSSVTIENNNQNQRFKLKKL